MFSPAVEDYAKAIYALQRGEGAVSTTALAERLGVTAASASGMVRKLDEHGLVTHVPYRGVRLTDEGTRLALEVLRQPAAGAALGAGRCQPGLALRPRRRRLRRHRPAPRLHGALAHR